MRPVKSTGNSRAQCAPGCFFVWVEVERTSRKSLPLEGKPKFRGGRAFSEIRCGCLFAQIWPRMLQTLRPTQGMSLTQNSIRTSRSTARAGTRRKTGIPLPKGRITALKSKIFKPGPTRCGKSIFCPEIPWRKICPSQYDDKLLYFSIKS